MRNRRGFTLLEVLVSILILSLGLMAVAGLQTTAISGNIFAKDGTIAIQMAEEMVERIRTNASNTPNIYDGINTSGSCSGIDPVLGDCNQWQARLQNSGLTGAFGTVAVAMDTPVAKAATVTVTVTWGAVPTASRHVTFTTILKAWLS